LEDRALAERACNGDVDAYENLVRQYQEIALRTAYLITRDAAEAEDVAQEAFVKAYLALDRFRPGASFRPWLLQIVANEARNRRKAAARRLKLTLRAGKVRPSGDAAPSPEAAALADEQQHALLAALDRLREADRLVIACRYFLELSEAEMAVVLDCRPGTVKSRLSRALARLRDAFPAAQDDREVSNG
jgi:RNA polymerase sigma factor (sigma-70 family)